MSVSLTFSIEGLTRKKRYVVYTERDIEREREGHMTAVVVNFGSFFNDRLI